jgi:hypothetical protein
MSESIEMFNARTTINDADKLSLILDQNFKFRYGCSVKVGVAELFNNNPSDDSYSIEISVNEEIQKLQAQLKDANETIEFYGDRSSWRYEEIEDCDACIIADDLSVPDGWCEENGGKRARKYLKKYKEVSDE